MKVNFLSKLLGRLNSDNTQEERRHRAAVARRPAAMRRPAVSRKVWHMLSLNGQEILTPWARKEKARRRAAGKAARHARRANRRYRATGGLR